jgi:hypothetical protein
VSKVPGSKLIVQQTLAFQTTSLKGLRDPLVMGVVAN